MNQDLSQPARILASHSPSLKRDTIDMDFHERSEEEPATDLQEVLNVFSALGGSEIWQLEWLIDRVEDRDWGMSWL